jgi:hypothetical protein
MAIAKSIGIFIGAPIATAVTGVWILATGFWNDSGVWDDSASWID